MSEKFSLDRKIGFQNTFYTKCINVIIDNIGPSINLRSIYDFFKSHISSPILVFPEKPVSGTLKNCISAFAIKGEELANLKI